MQQLKISVCGDHAPWRRCLLRALGLAAGLLVAVAAGAQPLRIVTVAVAPLGYYNERNQPTGVLYELGNLVAREAGLSFTNRIVPYQRASVMLASGEADMVLRNSNQDLERNAVPVIDVLLMPTIVISAASNAVRSLADLEGKVVGVPRGGMVDPHIDQNPLIRKHAVDDYRQMLQMVLRGRLDAGVGSAIGIYYNARQLGLPKTAFAAPLQINTRPLVLHFARSSAQPERIEALRAAVQRLQSRGEIDRLVKQYSYAYEP